MISEDRDPGGWCSVHQSSIKRSWFSTYGTVRVVFVGHLIFEASDLELSSSSGYSLQISHKDNLHPPTW